MYVHVYTMCVHVPHMYMSIHCMYMYIQCMYMCHSGTLYVHVYALFVHVYTMYVHGFTVHNFNQLSQQVLVANGHHRDADVPQPRASYARDNEDGGSPSLEDGGFFYARPDAAETEEAISKFISGLESQEQAGFD